MKATFRSKVMKKAWTIYRTTKENWSECLRKAWALFRLYVSLLRGTVKFCYYKVNGAVRFAQGTLKGMHFVNNSPATLTYYDVERNNFRKFRIENFICMEKSV